MFRYTELCKFHVKGTCLRGQLCRFAHDVSLLRTKPDLTKTQLCADWCLTGRCQRSADCAFAHGQAELRVPGAQGFDDPTERVSATRQKKVRSWHGVDALAQASEDLTKTARLCAEWHTTGRCRRGTECIFAHSQEELRVPSAQGVDPSAAGARGSTTRPKKVARCRVGAPQQQLQPSPGASPVASPTNWQGTPAGGVFPPSAGSGPLRGGEVASLGLGAQTRNGAREAQSTEYLYPAGDETDIEWQRGASCETWSVTSNGPDEASCWSVAEMGPEASCSSLAEMGPEAESEASLGPLVYSYTSSGSTTTTASSEACVERSQLRRRRLKAALEADLSPKVHLTPPEEEDDDDFYDEEEDEAWEEEEDHAEGGEGVCEVKHTFIHVEFCSRARARAAARRRSQSV